MTMDYNKDLQSLIARYNRELMRTYEQRQLPDEPPETAIETAAESGPETAPVEKPLTFEETAPDEGILPTDETVPLTFAITWEKESEPADGLKETAVSMPEPAEAVMDDTASMEPAAADTLSVTDVFLKTMPEEAGEETVMAIPSSPSMEPATEAAATREEFASPPAANERTEALSFSTSPLKESVAVKIEAPDPIPVMAAVEIAATEPAEMSMQDPEPVIHKEEQLVLSPAEPVMPAAPMASTVMSEPICTEETCPHYPLEDTRSPSSDSLSAAENSSEISGETTSPQETDEDGRPMDIGYIQVRVTTARTAIPIVGAYVTITSSAGENETVHFVALTDEDGLTPVFPIPAVSGQLSLEPGNPHPYTTYDVMVSAPGYFRVHNKDLPMFGGIHAVQPVELIPLPEGSDGEEPELVYPENGPENLE